MIGRSRQCMARDGREHLIYWYCERATPWLSRKVPVVNKKMLKAFRAAFAARP